MTTREITGLLVILVYLISVGYCVSNRNWNTLYSLTDGKIYLHLKNNDLVSLNFSISGFDQLDENSVFTESEINLKDNQLVSSLGPPPVNSSLFLVKNDLYGFNSQQVGSGKDICGNGLLRLIKYNEDTQDWDVIDELNFDDVEDGSFYQYSTYLIPPLVENTIYIYGGLCEESNQVSNRLISFSFDDMKFSNISTSTKPQSFYGAANLVSPNPQTQLVIGGQSNKGWLNMYQLATWSFDSGWSFTQISQDNGTKINSRKFPLALPVFSQLANSSLETISKYYKVDEVLLIGGELLSTVSTPVYAKLSFESNDWEWSSFNSTGITYDEILGAATIFNTLVVINSTSVSKKRDNAHNQYLINLYDTNTLTTISNLKDNIQTTNQSSSNSSDSTTIQKKAILGTVIPIAAIAMAVAAGVFLIRRRKRKQQNDELNDMNYQFGNYYDQESVLSEKIRNDKTMLNNDTNSTLEVASFESWIKKRQEFDEQRMNYVRNSYLASNDTLSSSTSNSQGTSLSDKYTNGRIIKPQPSSTQLSTNLVNKSVSKIKKSFSFTSSPPTSPIIAHGDYSLLKKKKSSPTLQSSRPLSHHLIIDDEDTGSEHDYSQHRIIDNRSVDITQLDQADPTTETIDDQNESESDSSIDDKMDVQVLVSSKRRSVLRVVNPDLDAIEDIEEDEQQEQELGIKTSTEIRQRVPSGEKNDDD